MDFGSCTTTGMHVSCVAELRKYYGLDEKPVKIVDPYQMLGEVDEELLDSIGISVDGIFPRETIFGFPNDNWKEWRTPWGQNVLVPGEFTVTMENGDCLLFPRGDTSAGPSARLPEGGYFFDSIIRQKEIKEDELKADDNLEEYTLLTDQNIEYYQKERKRAARSGRGLVVNFGGTTFGDIADIPGPGLANPKGIRDVTEWYISTVMRQDLLHEIFSRQLDIILTNMRTHLDIFGDDGIDVVVTDCTDFGTQNSSICSTDTYQSLYAPYHKKLNDWIHTNTNWKTFKHSCGAVYDFIPEFIESGFDILNPVQCSAAGMEPERLKREYGRDIVFWGGGVDTQKTLPFGSPEEVRRQVLERLEIFSDSGGYVFNAIHNVQAKTPIENIVAMINAVKEYNGDT